MFLQRHLRRLTPSSHHAVAGRNLWIGAGALGVGLEVLSVDLRVTTSCSDIGIVAASKSKKERSIIINKERGRVKA